MRYFNKHPLEVEEEVEEEDIEDGQTLKRHRLSDI